MKEGDYVAPLSYSQLSGATLSLWAKVSNVEGSAEWLPLTIHHSDTCLVMGCIWDKWLSSSDIRIISSGLEGISGDGGIEAKKLALFLAAVHDIGKASPVFQFKEIFTNREIQKEISERLEKFNLPSHHTDGSMFHSLISEGVLEHYGIHRTVSVVVGGHHGKPPEDNYTLDECIFEKNKTGWNDPEWNGVREELLGFALHISGTSLDDIRKMKLKVPAQVLLSGLLIMADWIASNDSYFPYDEEFIGYGCMLNDRLYGADEVLKSLSKWEPDTDCYGFTSSRFDRFKPRSFQKDVEAIAKHDHPRIMVIEAPMGEGKTEAALAAAEIMASENGKTGLMFALPTQATADGIFERIYEWSKKAINPEDDEIYSIFLAHGKSRFNKYYKEITKGNWNVGGDRVVVKEWFSGRKKGLLSDFVIGTVDQILMMGLKQKHLAMRHLGLSNKVVIIDECHAYDVYMGSYLETALAWLGAYNVPVILLSATLQPKRKFELIEAYKGESRLNYCNRSAMPEWAEDMRYPLITYLDNEGVKRRSSLSSGRSIRISLHAMTDSEIVNTAEEAASEGGFIGIIVNTVGRAQDIAQKLAERNGWDRVRLLHSRFISFDRSNREKSVLDELRSGERTDYQKRLFVVGTQVIEQSLDLDFDSLITDICPIDLLLQRIGRLHRHHDLARIRSKVNESARCFIIDRPGDEFPEGSVEVYHRLQLFNTRILLHGKRCINIPEDIPVLVHAAYGRQVTVPDCMKIEYEKASKDEEVFNSRKQNKAEAYQIRFPDRLSQGCLIGWLSNNVKDIDVKAEATVRDTNGSLDVIVIRRLENGSIHVLPWVMKGIEIPADSTPPYDVAFEMAGCKLSLPTIFSNPGSIDESISLLETSISQWIDIERWYESDWLKGELFLVLDEDMVSRQLQRPVRYDYDLGLVLE